MLMLTNILLVEARCEELPKWSKIKYIAQNVVSSLS